MYFPFDVNTVGQVPMRSQASYREVISARRSAVGLRAGGLFTDMESFLGPEFWGLDEMHLLGHGQSKLIYGMLDQKYNHVGCAVELANMGAAMEKSRPFIPSVFSGNWSDIHKHHGNYRAVDWYDFLLFVIPTQVTPHLQNEASAFALNSLVQGLTIAASWAVRSRELPLMSALFQAWHVFLDAYRQAEHVERLRQTTQRSVDYLIHYITPDIW
ncbi:hypothetical protein [Absidia glauca]|uniref:Uncharacterized protein n=1 Tax=Absidia glauca TaxID=4829 RepID=A0A163K3P3_ABSGL|nr:hypothetical protein [Absidia glauca]